MSVDGTVAPVPAQRPGQFPVVLSANPSNTLSFVVQWSTSEAATSVVDFGWEGALAWRVSDPNLTTAHQVLVYGMPPETVVSFVARSVTAAGVSLESEGSWTTGTPPPSVPTLEMRAYDPDRSQPGWTLVNVNDADADWPPTAAMYAADGRPMWYAITSNTVEKRGDLDTSVTASGHVLIGGSGNGIIPMELYMNGGPAWYGPPQDDPVQHHHFRQAADGTYWELRHATDATRPDLTLDQILNIDPDYNVLWSWNAFDHIAVPDGTTGDYLHSNSVTPTDDAVFLNSRNRGTIYKLDRATGDVVWRLGDGGDFAADPDAATPWFFHEHDPELEEDGRWLIYDNEGLEGAHTRVIEMAIDETAMTTKITWEFPGNFAVDPWYLDDWHSPIFGDADRLPNGNVLVTAGTRQEGHQTRIFEVTPDGDVVFEMLLPSDFAEHVVSSYRAERVAPPGLEVIEPESP